MKIQLITPASPGSRKGNRITAQRWARILRALGHHTVITQKYQGESCDVLVALHARRSFDAVQHFSHEHPDRPLILALTGTDLYADIHTDTQAQQALEQASMYIVLQPHGINELPPRLRPKARVIFQSVQPPPGVYRPKQNVFELCVLGHMRPVKDPFRTASAAAPSSSISSSSSSPSSPVAASSSSWSAAASPAAAFACFTASL